MEKRTCSLFNDDQLSSIINMLASSWIKRFFHSRKSEEILKSWTRNHMSLPLIGEKVKSGAITENKQKDLTKSSSTLLFDGEAPSLLFFIFLSPLSLKSLFAGERFGMVQQHLQRDGWQLTSDRPSELQTTQKVRQVRITYWPIKTRALVLEGHLALYYNLPHGKVTPFWTLL